MNFLQASEKQLQRKTNGFHCDVVGGSRNHSRGSENVGCFADAHCLFFRAVSHWKNSRGGILGKLWRNHLVKYRWIIVSCIVLFVTCHFIYNKLFQIFYVTAWPVLLIKFLPCYTIKLVLCCRYKVNQGRTGKLKM